MLALPRVGMRRSVDAHNVRLDVLADWIESTVLFDGHTLARSEVIDVLMEDNIYAKQGLAWHMVDNAWNEVDRRLTWLGLAAPIRMNKLILEPTQSWQEAPAHSFCLVLACAEWYPKWAMQFGKDYTQQGALFEALTKEALQQLFPDWVIHATGWTRDNAVKIDRVVKDVASRLGEEIGNVGLWAEPKANEAGLDLVCYRPFMDDRVGVPLFLLQCASGQDWRTKLHTPSLETWTKLVHFASRPKKAFAIPYALEDDPFRRHCKDVDGMLLDRSRLLAAGRTSPNWLSTNLSQAIVAWLEPRIRKLPRADV